MVLISMVFRRFFGIFHTTRESIIFYSYKMYTPITNVLHKIMVFLNSACEQSLYIQGLIAFITINLPLYFQRYIFYN